MMQSLYRLWAREEPVATTPSSPADGAQTPDNQFQSPLFKLPAEIRVVIWEYALSGELVHMEHCPAMGCYERPSPALPVTWAMLHKEERLDCGKTWAQKAWLNHMDWHFTSTVCSKNAELPDGQTVAKGAILGLPLSCKRIYQEALPFLYTGNTFDFKFPQDFICFSKTLPPYLVNPVRRIRIRLELAWGLHYTQPGHMYRVMIRPPVWRQVCDAVKHMKDLREVRVDLKQAVPLGHIAEVLLLLDELQVEHVVIETYNGMEEIKEYIEESGRQYDVEEVVPWDECFVTFAS